MHEDNSDDVFDDLESEERSAAYLHQAQRTLTVWRCAGKGPRYMKLGRKVFYRRLWLRQYMEQQTVIPKIRGGQPDE